MRTIDKVFRSFKAKLEKVSSHRRKKSSSRRRRSKREHSEVSGEEEVNEGQGRETEDKTAQKMRQSKVVVKEEIEGVEDQTTVGKEKEDQRDGVTIGEEKREQGKEKIHEEAFANDDDDDDNEDDDDIMGAALKQQEPGWEWEIDQNEIEVMEAIGSGAFGAVYRGRLWGSDVAVKTLHAAQKNQDNNPIIDSLKEESELLARLRHPNVVLYIGACTKLPNICIVTEWCARGSLYDLLHEETVPVRNCGV